METVLDHGHDKYKVQFAKCIQCDPLILAGIEDDKLDPMTALSGPNMEQWQTMMDAEVAQLQNLNTFELVPLPADRKIIGC